MNTTPFFLALSIMLFLNEGVEMMKDKRGCRTTNGVPCLHKTDPKVYQYFQYHKWNSTCFKYNGRKQRCMVSPGVLRPCKCSKQCGGCGNKRIPTDQGKSTSFKSLNSHKFKVSQRNGEFSAINKVPINMFKDSSNFDKEEKDPNHNCNVGSMDKDIIRKFNEIQRIVEGSNGEDEDQPMYKKGLNNGDGKNEDLENKGSSGNNSELSSEKLNYTQSKDSKSESKEEDEEESSSEMDEALESKSKLEDGPDYDDMESKAEKEEGPGDDTNESRTEMKQGSGDDGMNSKSEKEEVSGKKRYSFQYVI
ncbi:uncharacterized protein [Lepeophtheirus salmonis]|uniref:uncharacterized protein n=1 Tax=Lepeophtheirus salmonis TaxID=72036 RepID=UPI001AE44D0A|nr:YTH domain-containing protein 1-like [Lepeophtheirus salmonis]